MTVTSRDTDVRALAATLERVVTMMRRMMPSQAMSLTSVSVLRSLESAGPTRLTELASSQGVTQPGMTQLVTRLERDGYVERGSQHGDARVVLVGLTDAGAQFLRQRRELRSQRLHDLLRPLPAGDRSPVP